MDTTHFPFQIKQVNDEGAFTGIAAGYSNVDHGGDMIAPGAFREFDLTKDGQIRILAAHDQSDVIGKGLLSESTEGLAVRGKLNLAVAKARETYELLLDSTLDALSVGFSILPGGSEFKSGTRHLKALRLHEISVVGWPMNQLARISSVKSRPNDISDLETRIREEFSLSSREARRMAGAAWRQLHQEEIEDFDGLIDGLKNISNILKKGN